MVFAMGVALVITVAVVAELLTEIVTGSRWEMFR